MAAVTEKALNVQVLRGVTGSGFRERSDLSTINVFLNRLLKKIEDVGAKMMGKNQPGGLLVYRRYEP